MENQRFIIVLADTPYFSVLSGRAGPPENVVSLK
jgi:hypothetical protein